MGVNGYYTRRTYYPSGPLIDSGGSYSAPSCPTPPKLPNPDPANYKIIKSEQRGRFLVLMIHYPDCTNYEGKKILVFRDVTPLDLLNQKIIDPHFFKSSNVKSPVARFEPTDDGWGMALRFSTTENNAFTNMEISGR
jgi:hypothetical protein